MKKALKIVLIIVIVLAIVAVVVFAVMGITKRIRIKKGAKRMQQIAQNIVTTTQLQREEMETGTIKKLFKNYEGKKTGKQVVMLLKTIELVNKNQKKHPIKVTGITKESSVSEKENYNIAIQYDNDGYANTIDITKTK